MRSVIQVLPDVLVGLVIAGAFMSGVRLELAGYHASLSQLSACVGLGWLLFNRKHWPSLSDVVSVLLLLVLAINLVSSVLNSPHLGASLKNCGVILSFLVVYIVVRAHSNASMQMLSFACAATVSVGIGSYFFVEALATGEPNIGVSWHHLKLTLGENAPPSMRGLDVEPNLFAVSVAASLFLFFGLLQARKLPSVSWFAVPFFLAAILLAFTRTVYVAFVLGIICWLMLAADRVMIRRTLAGLGACIIVGFCAWLLAPSSHPVKTALRERVSSLIDFSSGTGAGRLTGYRAGLTGFRIHPVLGNGTLSAYTTYFAPEQGKELELNGSPGWLSGAWIQSLHDTGLVGFAVTMGIFPMAIYFSLVQFRSRRSDDPHRWIDLGLVCGSLIIFVAAQLSSSWFSPLPWVWLGIQVNWLMKK